ncbi:ribosomal protein L6e-domain-containing protein [Syncephalastrum racemosum]|uniref:60S ribosomal protein L6 n=1 Tax=Syncephalastrum racemosum TaxID=13706 RepID=A0A1X2HM32_SYNRA|nr:ribosomal protein L6e-domain-containing protein [Syncephalastrum racemosum]
MAPAQDKTVTTKGGKRTIPAQKAPRYYPAEDVKQPKVNRRTNKKTALRSSITPGTVLILLAGRFRGKRVVFLKQLDSGLLLVSGPFKVNGVPIRRVNQSYVIATSVKVDLANVKVPDVNDSFFAKDKKAAKEKFLEQKSEKKSLPENLVSVQKALDKELVASVSKDKLVLAYLKAPFGLSKGDFPHAMKF